MKKFFALLLALAMVLSLAACGGDKGNSGSDAKTDTPPSSADGTTTPDASSGEQEYNISVILKTTSSEYWGYVVAGAKAYEKDHPNVHVDVKGATSETAYDEQQNMIETDMNNKDIDGYVIAPLQADMVANMISGQKKPIVAVDTDIDAPEVLSSSAPAMRPPRSWAARLPRSWPRSGAGPRSSASRSPASRATPPTRPVWPVTRPVSRLPAAPSWMTKSSTPTP